MGILNREEGFLISGGFSLSEALLTFIGDVWDLFCLGLRVKFRDFVKIPHKLAKASTLGGRLVNSSGSSDNPLPSFSIKPAVLSRVSFS